MSLSFVKSAVLSSTDGISHNEETTIDNTETQSVRNNAASAGHKPLFEQLRANKDADQEKDDEFQRSLRGMRPLDEEDCAHLDAVDRVRDEREYAAKTAVEREVALFRAAREDRGLTQTVMMDDNEKDDWDGENSKITAEKQPIVAKKENKQIVPKFTIKKKRKRIQTSGDDNDTSTKVATEKKKADKIATNETETKKKPDGNASECDSDNNEGGGLLGLGCYGSDSD